MKLKIKEIREKKGITRQSLADKLDVSYSTVSKWENEDKIPPLSKIVELSDLFDVSLDYLTGRTNQEKINKKDSIIISESELREIIFSTLNRVEGEILKRRK